MEEGFMLDIAIIGAGPAGLSAAITGMIRKKKIQVFGSALEESELYRAEKIENYIGLLGISGRKLIEIFNEHAKELQVPLTFSNVNEIFPMQNYYILSVEGEFIEARSIILANGSKAEKTLEGEATFIGRGVSYCATCDGRLYQNQTVVLIADTMRGEEEASYLAQVCKKVYYIPLYSPVSRLNDSIEILQVLPKRILGETHVNVLEHSLGQVDVEGVFIVRKNKPIKQLLGCLELDNQFIKVNRKMETNLPGVFAAGDCTGRPFQIAKAVGEGNVAILEAISYLYKTEATFRQSKR